MTSSFKIHIYIIAHSSIFNLLIECMFVFIWSLPEVFLIIFLFLYSLFRKKRFRILFLPSCHRLLINYISLRIEYISTTALTTFEPSPSSIHTSISTSILLSYIIISSFIEISSFLIFLSFPWSITFKLFRGLFLFY